MSVVLSFACVDRRRWLRDALFSDSTSLVEAVQIHSGLIGAALEQCASCSDQRSSSLDVKARARARRVCRHANFKANESDHAAVSFPARTGRSQTWGVGDKSARRDSKHPSFLRPSIPLQPPPASHTTQPSTQALSFTPTHACFAHGSAVTLPADAPTRSSKRRSATAFALLVALPLHSPLRLV